MKNLKKSILFFILMLNCLPSLLHAQRAQAFYVEGFGNALFYSLNYDTRFAKGTDKWGARIGVGFYREVVANVFQVNYLIGADKHKLEIGAGISTQLGFGGEKGRRDLAPNAALMYRFQNPDGNFIFRGGLGPIFIKVDEDDTFGGLARVFWFWPGISLGYAF